MSDGLLHAGRKPGTFAIGGAEGTLVEEGQSLEILLGGHWISGRIEQRHTSSMVTQDQSIVTEASEESFPGSDAPSWSADPQRSEQISGASDYIFVADADRTRCALCIGMRMRIR